MENLIVLPLVSEPVSSRIQSQQARHGSRSGEKDEAKTSLGFLLANGYVGGSIQPCMYNIMYQYQYCSSCGKDP